MNLSPSVALEDRHDQLRLVRAYFWGTVNSNVTVAPGMIERHSEQRERGAAYRLRD